MRDLRTARPQDYDALTWPEKAHLLQAILDAGDHPPGFSITFCVDHCTAAEREYLCAIGIGPSPDKGLKNAR